MDEAPIEVAVKLLKAAGYVVTPGPKLVDRMGAEYMAGATLREISVRYSVPAQTLRRYLIRSGVPMREGGPQRGRPGEAVTPLTPEEVARLRQLVGILDETEDDDG